MSSDLRSTARLAGLTVLLGLASALAIGLQLLREELTGQPGFSFLWWNLFLAWVPYMVSLVMVALHAARAPGWLLAVPGVVWLLFLPNAPYLITDFIHLGAIPGVPLWFDAALLGAFAGAGLALGLASLMLVHHIVATRLGPVAGWVLAVGSLALSSFGVYLGRFPRFNSWDVVTNLEGLVGTVLMRLADPLGNPFLIAFAATMTAGLLASYLVTWWIGRDVVRPPGRRVAQYGG